MMDNTLVDHAVSNVWAEPDQDYQHLIRALPYTTSSGRIGSVELPNQVVKLPVVSGQPNARFHLYHFGNLPKDRIALTNFADDWQNVPLLMSANRAQIDIVGASGVIIPRSSVWLKRLRDQNFVMAIQVIDKVDLGRLPDGQKRRLCDETIYVRFYRNAITKQPAWMAGAAFPSAPFFYDETLISQVSDFTSFVNNANGVISNYGGTSNFAIWTLDGFRIQTPVGYTAKYLGKRLAVFFDSTVKAVVEWSVGELTSFDSLVDPHRQKYFVPGDSNIDTIDFHDDVDVFVGDGSRGVYLARIQESFVRQLTHSSYSIMCSAVDGLVNAQGDFSRSEPAKITLYIRSGGMNHSLLNNALYFQELYRLDLDRIKSLMVGSGAVVPCWRAREIEASNYNRLLSSACSDLSASLVARGYGFHMVQKILFTPVFQATNVGGQYTMTFSLGYARIPEVNGNNASVYYYDENGLLVSGENRLISAIQVGNPVVCTEQSARIIEVLPDPISTDQWGDVYYGSVVSDSGLRTHGFKCYICTMVGGAPDEVWVDVTGSPWYTYTSVDANHGGQPSIVWNTALLAQHNAYPAIKIDRGVLFYEQDVSSCLANGFIRFSVTSRSEWLGVNTVRQHGIPYEHLNIWMDGHPLVMGVDYYCQWPQVVVCKPPADPNQTTLMVRAYGLCSDGVNGPRQPDEVGFTRGGLVSANRRYNLWEDRLCRVVVDNALRLPDSVPYSESSGQTPWEDGRPYEVRLYRFNVDWATDGLSEELRTQADINDVLVSDQLSVLLPDNYPVNAVVDGARHVLYSPALSAIVYAMANHGFLGGGELSGDYNPETVSTLLHDYLYLFDYDPTRHHSDGHFVNIRPHLSDQVLSVTSDQYAFLQYLIKHYLRDQVDLNSCVQIGA